jgi:opacity protein-like surface antigen
LGFEYKPISTIALRLGYNYVSPKFESDGFRDQTLDSQGVAYATSTDYTNWKSTNRITAGVGFTFDKLYLDMAYQYSQTNGDFYPFMNYSVNDVDGSNYVAPTSVSNKRNQLLVTLGYRF